MEEEKDKIKSVKTLVIIGTVLSILFCFLVLLVLYLALWLGPPPDLTSNSMYGYIIPIGIALIVTIFSIVFTMIKIENNPHTVGKTLIVSSVIIFFTSTFINPAFILFLIAGIKANKIS